ncbi:Helicase conserved C-terminal domain-containing protein [Geodermatophilus telluris]|uniref:Helicase conserved C-terminal domain-containing protein n=1 Tax=Geodermatophilus telluris TaxID=1190417 RepID=A0A1G6PER3_9ACTN|nr:helicase-related protein [Geodermatophilus telluris]SDC77825.1 Helicase conserved C-terminal domain-containing protein [Geodermatophilus telluris]
MSLTTAQQSALDHVRAAYVGPSEGDDEVLYNRPDLQYVVGMLFPQGSAAAESNRSTAAPQVSAPVSEGEVEEDGARVPLAEDWRPSSVAISFVTDSTVALCDVRGGTYARVPEDGPPRWQRRPFAFTALELVKGQPPQQLRADDVPFEIGARWRPFRGGYLVTVHARVLATSTNSDKLDVGLALFQFELDVKPGAGGHILEYDRARAFDLDDESSELRLRYRDRKVYAVGHGMAADWNLDSERCAQVFLTPVPAFIVPSVETTGFAPDVEEAHALRLDELSRMDTAPDDVLSSLGSFVRAFSTWVAAEEARVETFGEQAEIAQTIIARSRAAVRRMEESVDLLRNPDNGQLRQAFALAMAAMRLQMSRAATNRGEPAKEPRWRPFQLGFLLVALASTVDERHADRELVDLIWFPTGGGKTEAYLGLAAIEVFHRRLAHGAAGGGTAIITRYTLRLLTAQQFQRAASLICAMELLRTTDRRAKGMTPFSIGLWVGNDVTPGTAADAKWALERLHKAARPEEANGFQVEGCPWCLAPLVPRRKETDPGRYGFRLVGKDVVIHCTDERCPFNRELPLAVVDEVLFDAPPTILLATVDKFARLQFKPEAGALLGIDTVFRQPSMIIQDELHLLSGPLGTTVAVFDAVIQILLSRGGCSPKIVASTATIRSSEDQVKGLYGRKVALYPPSGLDGDKTFFSQPVESGEGRLYIGLMPQSVSQASALVAAAAPLVELPEVFRKESRASLDSYWTLVMYHNSLRELGRTSALILDDVNGRLETRSERLGLPLRRVRAGRVLELTSRRGPEELPNDLRELRVSADDSDQAIDVVLSSNMLSVGIDIPRLALMLMVGQPKTTAEYIQATSRVGRGDNNGIVVTLFRSNRARDRSHFETFRGYHEALYRSVEPTSVTPWSLASRERSLAGALVALVRHSFRDLASDSSAVLMDLDDSRMSRAMDQLVTSFVESVVRSDAAEKEEAEGDVWSRLRDWDRRAALARKENGTLKYERRAQGDNALLKRFGQSGEGWVVGDSMRSVEPNVAVEVQEPLQEVDRGED